MTSEIRANTIKNRVGLGTVSFTNTGVVVSGIVTANSFSGPLNSTGDITSTGNITISNTTPTLTFTDTDANPDFQIKANTGHFYFVDATNNQTRFYVSPDGTTNFEGNLNANKDFSVERHTNLDNVSISGVTTFTGAITANSTLYVGSDLTITDKIVHNGDTNTAIRFPAADQIQLETGGSSRVNLTNDRFQILNRLLTSGDYNYLSGTSTTTATLTLKKSASGADSIDYLQLRDNSNGIKFTIHGDGTLKILDTITHEGDTDTKIRFPAADQVSIETAGNQRFRIDSSGNVGIDETGTILGKLHVVGGRASGTAYNAAVFAGGQNSTSGSGVKLYLSGCENSPIDRGVILESIMTNNSNAHRFSILVSGSSATPTERLRIDSNGRLTVGSSLVATSNGIAEFHRDIGGGAEGCHILVKNTSTNSVNNTARLKLETSGGTAQFYAFATGVTELRSRVGGTADWKIRADGASNMRFFTDDEERLRINSSGQLIQGYSSDPYNNRAATFQSPSGVTSTYVAIVNTETNGQCGILFGDHAGQNVGNYDGYINYDHSNQSMAFLLNGGNEKLRINNNGAFGLSGSNYGTSGQVLTSQGSGSAVQWASVSAFDGALDGMIFGGTETTYTSGGTTYKVHTFLSTGFLRVTATTTMDILVVAGGGGSPQAEGYQGSSGGGGAGGMVEGSSISVPAGKHTMTVGAGGAASDAYTVGGTGGDSTFAINGGSTITAKGGGGGADYASTGGTGGSGGGGAEPNTSAGSSNQSSQNSGISGISQYGNAGGQGGSYYGSNDGSGGGGGAGGAGNARSAGGGGGSGTANSITGSSVTYAAGGAGGSSGVHSGTAGTNGRGNGASGASASGSEGSGAAGGSGIIIVRYVLT